VGANLRYRGEEIAAAGDPIESDHGLDYSSFSMVESEAGFPLFGIMLSRTRA
jgi:hypothetical protein